MQLFIQTQRPEEKSLVCILNMDFNYNGPIRDIIFATRTRQDSRGKKLAIAYCRASTTIPHPEYLKAVANPLWIVKQTKAIPPNCSPLCLLFSLRFFFRSLFSSLSFSLSLSLYSTFRAWSLGRTFLPRLLRNWQQNLHLDFNGPPDDDDNDNDDHTCPRGATSSHEEISGSGNILLLLNRGSNEWGRVSEDCASSSWYFLVFSCTGSLRSRWSKKKCGRFCV